MFEFDQIRNRKNEFSAKYDELDLKFGRSDLYAMWVADMDLPVAPPILKAIEDRAKAPIYGYTTRPESYGEAVKNWYQSRYNLTMDPAHLIHSPGVVTSLNLAVRELTAVGDEIIIQPPVYNPFYDAVRLNERVLIENPLRFVDGDYQMDFDLLEKQAVSAKLLILCNPHNPVGRVWTKEELAHLADICLRHKVKVIADEIHGDIVFDNCKYTPFASLSEEANAISITCFSATKPFNIAGLQASLIYASQAEDRQKFEQFFTIFDLKRNNCFSLVAVEAAYREGEPWLNAMLAYVRQNMVLVSEFCKERLPELKPNMPEGTYLQWVDCRDLHMTDEDLSQFMIQSAKIALNTGTCFGPYGSGYVRLNLACPKAYVEAALHSLEKAVVAHRLEKAVASTPLSEVTDL